MFSASQEFLDERDCSGQNVTSNQNVESGHLASPGSKAAPATQRQPARVPQPPRAARRFLPALLIVAAALLAYAPVLRAGFNWDDDVFLTENPLIHASDGLYRFWFTTTPPDYFPLTSSMLWFEWRMWGQNALGYHVVNVLLHALSAMLLWRVLLRLKIPGALLAGLLFAVHPVAVASVAWITERKNTLSLAFFLASLLAYLRFDVLTHHDDTTGTTNGNPQSAFRNPHYLLSLALFLLALLAKTSVVMLPVVLLGCAWWRRGRVARRDFVRALPFAGLAAALGFVTIWYQYHNAIGAEVVRTDGPAARAAGAGWAVWFYLYKALLPVKLCPIYPRWTTSASLSAFVPGLLFLGMLGLFARFRRSWGRPFLFALGYFLVALLPVLGFLNIYFMRYSLVADQWQYVALIGVVSLAAGLPAWVMERHGSWRTAATAVACALVLCCGALTFRQTLVYQDEETLWRDTLAKNPKAWIAHGNLAFLLAGKAMAPGEDSPSRRAEAERYCREALRELDQAIALNPGYAEAYSYRGNLYSAANRYAEALRDYDQAIALKPDYAEACINRGNLLASAGHYAQAIPDYDQAIALRPDSAEAWFNRGKAYVRAGHNKEAMRDLDQAIALKPDYAEAYINRGNLHAAAQDYPDALHDYAVALEIKPDDFVAYNNRGAIRAAANRYAEAIGDYTRAIEINPRYAGAYLNRAIAYYAMKDYPRALSDVSAAQRLGGRPNPDFLRVLDKAAGHSN